MTSDRLSAIAATFHDLRQLWLVKSTMVFVGLGLLRGLSQFAFIMLMTRLLLPSDYGLYSNFLYTTSILSPLFFLKSDVPVARHYAISPDDIADYIGSIVLLCSGVTLISAIALWFLQSFVFQLTGIPGAWQLLIVITCWTFGLLLVVLGVLQIELRAWAMSFARIVPAMCCEMSVLAAVYSLSGGWRTTLVTYTCMSATWGISFVAWLRFNGYLRFRLRWDNVRDFALVSVPLIPMSIGFMSVQISAQFLLTHYAGADQVGIYAAANQFSLGVWLLALSSQQAFLPWLFNALSRNSPADDFKILLALVGIVTVLLACTVVYVVVFKLIFPLVVGPTFVRGDQLLGRLAWANFFLGVQMLMNCFLYYRKRSATSAFTICLAAAFGLALGILFIPRGGAPAAAAVTEISAAFAAVLSAVVVLLTFGSTFRNGVRILIATARSTPLMR